MVQLLQVLFCYTRVTTASESLSLSGTELRHVISEIVQMRHLGLSINVIGQKLQQLESGKIGG